ncbi:MAG: hypothetical protein BRD48_02900 [Bacteroidetes bacterium QS_9_68_14]|nr:MAG: hypothetical protein BRD48_02900 [Bacteroidetes bacterium QS_9_68_14]
MGMSRQVRGARCPQNQRFRKPGTVLEAKTCRHYPFTVPKPVPFIKAESHAPAPPTRKSRRQGRARGSQSRRGGFPRNDHNVRTGTTYEPDLDLGILRIDRIVPTPAPYPASHGFLPQTLGQDGDLTDAMVLMQNRPSRPRCSPPASSVSSTSLTRAKTTTGSSVSTSTTPAIASTNTRPLRTTCSPPQYSGPAVAR